MVRTHAEQDYLTIQAISIANLTAENVALQNQARILSAAVDRAEKAQDILQGQVKLLMEVQRIASGIKARRNARGFYMPEDTNDLMEALAATEPKEKL